MTKKTDRGGIGNQPAIYVLCLDVKGMTFARDDKSRGSGERQCPIGDLDLWVEEAVGQARVKPLKASLSTSGAPMFYLSVAGDAHALGRELLHLAARDDGTDAAAAGRVEIRIGLAKCRNGVGMPDRPTEGECLAQALSKVARGGEICACVGAYGDLPERHQRAYGDIETVEAVGDGPGAFEFRRSRLFERKERKAYCVVSIDMAHYRETVMAMEDADHPNPVAMIDDQIRTLIRNACQSVGAKFEAHLDTWRGDGGILLFERTEEAVRMGRALLIAARDRNQGKSSPARMRCFRVGIDYGWLERSADKHWRGRCISDAERLQEGGGHDSLMHCSGEIRISHDAFEELPGELRQKFGGKEPVPGKAHELPLVGHRWAVDKHAPWEKEPPPIAPPVDDQTAVIPVALKDCFVIMPLNPAHPRSRTVMERLIRPACQRAGYRSIQADQLTGQNKWDRIVESLERTPMVVAYLGAPTGNGQFNANVMIEVGFRLATGRPIVLLRDEPARDPEGDEEERLPFNLNDKTVYQVPEDPIQKLDALVKELEAGGGQTWLSPRPFVEYRVHQGRGGGERPDIRATFVSEKARQLFGTAIDEGKPVAELVEALRESIPEKQFNAFFAEQGRIYDNLLLNVWGRDAQVPVATIPIIFKETPDQPALRRGRAFLPLVVQHRIQFKAEGQSVYMRIVYLDVTKVTRMTDGGYCECDLGGGL
ncbi:MAG TPA: hypothetical protein PLU30_12600 [Verrucomicrobiae bacterium]|nr:hypothetical protein [Verrucomicrobiae bacterium]